MTMQKNRPRHRRNAKSLPFVLREAARVGDTATIEKFIKANRLHPRRSDRNNYALQAAAQNGHTDCVLALLPFCNPAEDESIALRRAAEYGHVECVQALLPVSNPAQIDHESLWQAADKGHAAIVALLLPHCARPCAVCGAQTCSDPSHPHPPHPDGLQIALVRAASSNQVTCLRQILAAGPTFEDCLIAAQVATRRGHVETVHVMHAHSPAQTLQLALSTLTTSAQNLEDSDHPMAPPIRLPPFALINILADRWSPANLDILLAEALEKYPHPLFLCPVLQAHQDKMALEQEVLAADIRHAPQRPERYNKM